MHDQTAASAHHFRCTAATPVLQERQFPAGINVLSDVSRPDIRHLIQKGSSAGTYLGGSGISQTLNIVSIGPAAKT